MLPRVPPRPLPLHVPRRLRFLSAGSSSPQSTTVPFSGSSSCSESAKPSKRLKPVLEYRLEVGVPCRGWVDRCPALPYARRDSPFSGKKACFVVVRPLESDSALAEHLKKNVVYMQELGMQVYGIVSQKQTVFPPHTCRCSSASYKLHAALKGPFQGAVRNAGIAFLGGTPNCSQVAQLQRSEKKTTQP